MEVLVVDNPGSYFDQHEKDCVPESPNPEPIKYVFRSGVLDFSVLKFISIFKVHLTLSVVSWFLKTSCKCLFAPHVPPSSARKIRCQLQVLQHT